MPLPLAGIAAGVAKSAVKKAATGYVAGRVANLAQGQGDGNKPMQVEIKKPKPVFRGADLTEFRGY